MGVRTHVFLSQDLLHFDDAAAAVARLDVALPESLAVRDYWRRVDPDFRPAAERWQAEPVLPRMPNVRRYTGPGSLFVSVTPPAACVSAAARWRGFLTIDPLRRVHLAAFRAIARTLGSASLALCADARDDVTDVFLAHGSQADCIAALRFAMGPPQPSVESIVPDVGAVWFLDGEPSADESA